MTGVIVGVDGSDSAAEALRWAAKEAGRHRWPLTALLAWDYLEQYFEDGPRAYRSDYSPATAEAALAAYVTRALGPDEARAVTLRTVCDRPAEALVAASQEASLLVVGERGLGPVRTAFLGSASYYCAHYAACPVAVVHTSGRASDSPEPERIVVGVDGSATSRKALQWAADEARLAGASLEVVHTWHLPYVGREPFGPAFIDADAIETAAREVLADCVASVDLRGIHERVETVLVQGRAAATVLETAKGADLVVVGARGVGGFGRLMLGSVSHQVALHAESPVVIVPVRA